MEKILFIGGSSPNGLGQDIFEQLKCDFYVEKIGRKELYSDEYIKIVNTLQPKHIIISTYFRCKKELEIVSSLDIIKSIESKTQPLLRVSQNLNSDVSSVLVFSGILSDIIELGSLPTSLAAACVEKMVEYLSVHYQGRVRFNCIKPWRMATRKEVISKRDFISTEDVFIAAKMILQNNAMNGASITVDRGYSINCKQGIKNE
ncbi:hypothetical protein E4659_11750 [Dickeya dianthicola]|uniref:Uncharacterized protein n=1 Tax=Dickeya dianthicola TaxID=204039 RepID=A0ABX9NTV6_9GAMM|nr:hypothetical protein [Dickeya dianthicola]MCA7005518.1 hypothetical protein [Dickeya dianthicola]MCI4114074.1 hypothetical protein [Dickeya dianthicola]MCI4118383.1 hypothetical protein [Dickeya dianthicola]MCI4125105.1 hypothetical protein [Dickeya dianthicola]MCI4155433.1 hypothetical protein [Dickeya dianthicola]